MGWYQRYVVRCLEWGQCFQRCNTHCLCNWCIKDHQCLQMSCRSKDQVWDLICCRCVCLKSPTPKEDPSDETTWVEMYTLAAPLQHPCHVANDRCLQGSSWYPIGLTGRLYAREFTPCDDRLSMPARWQKGADLQTSSSTWRLLGKGSSYPSISTYG